MKMMKKSQRAEFSDWGLLTEKSVIGLLDSFEQENRLRHLRHLIWVGDTVDLCLQSLDDLMAGD